MCGILNIFLTLPIFFSSLNHNTFDLLVLTAQGGDLSQSEKISEIKPLLEIRQL